MEATCKYCKNKIDSANVNSVKDIVYCSSCENLSTLSTHVSSKSTSSFDPISSERGIKITDHRHSWSIEASYLSLKSILFVPLIIVWVSASIGSLFKDQIAGGDLNLMESLTAIPFLIVDFFLIIAVLMILFGCIRVSNENGKAYIFTGIGSIGWYRRFEWRFIDRVSEASYYQYTYISLEGHSRFYFGRYLSSKKRYFIMSYLQSKMET